MILCIIIALGVLNWLVEWSNSQGEHNIGLTYSPRYATELRLDPQSTFIKMLDDLKVKYLRFPIYWDEIEKTPGQYDFSKVDWYIQEAAKRDVKINLVLGYKQPRWPECFAPSWANKLSIEQFSDKVVELVGREVEHFGKYDNVIRWQVENEPSLPFGFCNKPDPNRLAREVEVVRNKDTREIVITESGELSDWTHAMKLADATGVSVYRTVWNPWIGLVDYPLPATFYTAKNIWSGMWSGKNTKKTFVAELQTEPWGTKGRALQDISSDELAKLFPVSKLTANLNYAKRTGMKEIYLWGVEWWYMMTKSGNNDYLDIAKRIF